ncbi:MAG: translocation/assembly module TamB domain-containing protein [Sphaerotilus natans]
MPRDDASAPSPSPDTPPAGAPALSGGGRGRRGSRWALALLTLVLLLTAAATLLLSALGSQDGSRRLLSMVPGLTVDGLRGRLAGDLDIDALELALGPGRTLRLEHLAWRGLQAGWPRGEAPSLRLASLEIGAIDLRGRSADDSPAVLPTALALPLALSVDRLHIGRLRVDAIRDRPVQDIVARIDLPAGSGARHRIDALALRWDRIGLRGRLALGAAAPLPLEAQLEIEPAHDTPVPDWRLDVGTRGPLARLALQARLVSHGQALDAEAEIRPDQRQPLSRLQAQMQAFDLAPFASGLPTTALSGRIDAQLDQRAGAATAQQLRVQADLVNHQPGRLDRQRIPVETLRLGALGDLRTADTGTLETLRIGLHDGRDPAGTVLGSGRWSIGSGAGTPLELALSATLQDLRPSRLDPRAPAMHVSGPLTLTWSQPQAASPPAAAVALPRATLLADLRGRLSGPAPGGAEVGEVRLLLQAQATAQRLELERLLASSGSARLEASGRAERSGEGRDERWRLRLQAGLAHFDPSLWWPGEAQGAWQRGPHRLDGHLDTDLTLPRPAAGVDAATLAASIDGQAHAELQPSVLAGVPLSGRLQLQRGARSSPAGSAGPLQADLALQAGAGAGSAEATELTLRGALAERGADDRWQATLRSGTLERLQPWLRLAGLDARLAGDLRGEAELQGRWPALRLQSRLDAGRLELPQRSTLRGLKLQARAGLQSAGDPLEIDLDLDRLEQPGRSLEALTLRGHGSLQEHQLNLDGRLVSAAASPADPGTDAGAGAGDVAATPRRLQLRLALDGRLAEASRWLAAPDGPLNWQGRLRELDLRGADPAASAPVMALLHLDDLPLSLQRLAEGATQLRAGPGRLALLDGRVAIDTLEARLAPQQPPRLALQARLEPLALAPVLQRLQPDLGWSGDLVLGGHLKLQSADGRTTLDGALRRESGDLSLEDRELGTGPRHLGLREIALQLQAADGLWQFSQRIDGSQLGRIDGRQSLRTRADQPWPAADSALDGRLELQVAQLEHWGGWLPAGWRLGGKLAGQAQIGGRAGAPTYAGTLQGSGLSVRNVLEGIDWRDAQLRVRLDGETARIDTFTVRAGTGTLDLRGQAELAGSPVLTLRLEADRFAALQRIDRRVVLSGGADLRLDAQQTRLQGRLKIDEGRFDLSQSEAPSLGDDVDVDRGSPGRGTRARDPAPASRRTTALDLRVDLGERFMLRGRGLGARLTGELRVGSPAGRLAVQGAIHAVDGTYAAYGQKLRIERSVISFTGVPENPRLDIEAIRPDLEDVRVGVSVTGTAQNPRVRLISEPSMSDTDRLSWLILGRASDGLGRTDLALLQRAATALIAGENDAPSLVERIGLDQLSVRQSGDGDSRETVVTLGKQISQRWYVGYERSLTAASGTWQLIYRAARRFTLRAQSGADNALDLIWTWQWGSPALLPPVRAASGATAGK